MQTQLPASVGNVNMARDSQRPERRHALTERERERERRNKYIIQRDSKAERGKDSVSLECASICVRPYLCVVVKIAWRFTPWRSLHPGSNKPATQTPSQRHTKTNIHIHTH